MALLNNQGSIQSINNTNWLGEDLAVTNGGTGVSTITGIVKGNGANAMSPAIAGTDYLAPAAIGTTVQGYDANIPTVAASQAEMEAGTETAIRSMSPANIKQAIDALSPNRNKIINGKMEIAQRGTSFAAIATGAYSVDRWVTSYSTSAVVTASQQADVPSSNEFQSSLRVAVTTADASIAASDNLGVFQNIEGFNVRDLIGRTFTLSFWVRSSKTGIHCVSLRNSAPDRTYVAEYTVNAVNTWEQKSITVSGGLITAGTWNWTNGLGLSLGFSMACGSTYQTTANAWQTGNFLATANQVNCLDTIGNIFAITGVQLEAGSLATPFEHRQYGTELALCQRYYWRKGGDGGALSYAYLGTGFCNSVSTASCRVPHPPMRINNPTYSYSGTINILGNVGLTVMSISGSYNGWVVLNASNGTLTPYIAANIYTSTTANDWFSAAAEL